MIYAADVMHMTLTPTTYSYPCARGRILGVSEQPIWGIALDVPATIPLDERDSEFR